LPWLTAAACELAAVRSESDFGSLVLADGNNIPLISVAVASSPAVGAQWLGDEVVGPVPSWAASPVVPCTGGDWLGDNKGFTLCVDPTVWTRASIKCIGNFLPRLSALLRIPAAAFGLKEYFGWARGTKMSDNVDTAAALGHSEVLRVEYPPRQAVPEVGQRIHDDSEIVSFSGSKEPWNVLDEEPRRAERLRDAGELEEEAATFPGEPGPLASD